MIKWHLGMAVIVVIVSALGLTALYFAGVTVFDFALGFFSGIGLYSLYWRWRYGFWPD